MNVLEASTCYNVTKDSKAAGLKKKIGTEKFIGITAMMMDIMAPVTVLSQFFQTDNVDIALVKVKLEMAVEDLHKIKAMKSPCLTALADDLQNGKFKGHEITSSRASFSLDELCSKFVDKLVENIKSRFPDTSLLSSFGILSLRPLSFLSDEQLRVFGEDELDRLIAHYGEEPKHTWKEEGENQISTSPPIINGDEARQEWALLKRIVKAQHYPRDSLWRLWALISKYHSEDFPNLLILAQLATMLAVHTAGCERGFSSQNLILTPHRNRLTVDHQEELLKVNLGPKRPDFPFEDVLVRWKEEKERKLYSVKYTSN